MTFQSCCGLERTVVVLVFKLEEDSQGCDVWSRGSEIVAGHRHGADPPASLRRPKDNPLFEIALERLALRSAYKFEPG